MDGNVWIYSDDHYIYYYGQESHRRNGVALIINRRVLNAVLGCNLKNDRMISVHFQGKPFNITEIQDFVPTTDAERSWSWSILWRSRRPARTNTKKKGKKDILLIIGDWNAKVGSQEIPGIIGKFGLRPQWSRAKANIVLPREQTGHSKHILPTTQETTLHVDITRWAILKSDWLYSLQLKMDKLYTASKNKTGSWLWLRSWTSYCKIQT